MIKKLHIYTLILTIALVPHLANGAYYQPQEYEGYRLYFHFASVVKKKSDWMLVKYSVINTGNKEVAFGSESIPESIILNFDEKILNTEIGENLDAFRSALYATNLKIIPGQNLDKLEMKIFFSSNTKENAAPLAQAKTAKEKPIVKAEKVKKESKDKNKKKEKTIIAEESIQIKSNVNPVEESESLADHIEARTTDVEAEGDFGSEVFDTKLENENNIIPEEEFVSSLENTDSVFSNNNQQNNSSDKIEIGIDELVEDEGAILISDITEPLTEEKTAGSSENKVPITDAELKVNILEKDDSIPSDAPKVETTEEQLTTENKAGPGPEEQLIIEESSFTTSTSDVEEKYFDINTCADLVVADIKILKNSNRMVTLEYTVTNQGAGPAHLYGKGRILEDNLALRAHLSSSEKLTKGAILLTGEFLPNRSGSAPLEPNESITATIKLEKFKMTKFTPYIILELDTFQNIIECNETNNRKAIKVD